MKRIGSTAKLVLCLTTFTATLALTGAHSLAQNAPKRRKPLRQENSRLLLRVLPRPFSNVHRGADKGSDIVRENINAFQPLYVYTQGTKKSPWYEVGSDNRGNVVGWMRSEDVIEWKQALCLEYTHPSGRHPVLMFARKNDLQQLISSSPAERQSATRSLYSVIESRDIPDDFPVLSIEPKRAINQTDEAQFYLLPILEHQQIRLDGREARLLKVAAATNTRGATTLNDQGYLDIAVQNTGSAGGRPDLQIEIVYVIDLTSSMQAFIDSTRKVIREVADSLATDPELAKNVRFGLWGYRDSTDIEGIGFNTRNYTPVLQQVNEFSKTLNKVKITATDSKDYPEDIFSGVDKAMRETAWNNDALRFIVLIGDAPSHEAGHKWNTSGQSATTLREYADENRLNIYAIHIKDTRAARYHDLAEEQFMTLSRNRGLTTAGGSSYDTIDSKDITAFENVSSSLLDVFNSTLVLARKKLSASSVVPAQKAKPRIDVTGAMASEMVRAALVDWLGRKDAVQAPRDVTAWVTEKDIIDPTTDALHVNVLVTKNQLSSLRTVLKEIMEAGTQAQMGGMDFFESLQATSATLTRNPDRINSADRLAKAGYIPDFMSGLPFKSRIMNMDDNLWRSLSMDQQDDFLEDIRAKIELYEHIHNNATGWIPLNEGDDPDEHIRPLSLDMLP